MCYEFLCALRGFRAYKNDWIPSPRPGQVLFTVAETGNVYDVYAVALKLKRRDRLVPITVCSFSVLTSDSFV